MAHVRKSSLVRKIDNLRQEVEGLEEELSQSKQHNIEDEPLFLSPIKRHPENLMYEPTKASDDGVLFDSIDSQHFRMSRELGAPSNAHQGRDGNFMLNFSLPHPPGSQLAQQEQVQANESFRSEAKSDAHASSSIKPPTDFDPAAAFRLVQDRMLKYSEKIRNLTGVNEAPLQTKLNERF